MRANSRCSARRCATTRAATNTPRNGSTSSSWPGRRPPISTPMVPSSPPRRGTPTPLTQGREGSRRLREHQANGMGGLPLVGDPDAVAGQMAQLAAAGLTGIAVSFVNYLDELPYFCAEVLPRLARLGWREKM